MKYYTQFFQSNASRKSAFTVSGFLITCSILYFEMYCSICGLETCRILNYPKMSLW